MTPAWILDIFAALMLVVAAVSAARLVAARPWRSGSDRVVTDTDVAHLLMAVAMAGTLAPGLATLPDTGWEFIFGLLTVWFTCRVMRDARANGVRALVGGHCAPHLAHSAAMLYMFLAIAAPAAGNPGMAGMARSATRTLEYPTAGFVFALILAGYSIWDLDQLSGKRYSLASARVALAGVAAADVPVMASAESGTAAFSGPAAGGYLLSAAVTVGCRIAMGVTMALMLLIMI